MRHIFIIAAACVIPGLLETVTASEEEARDFSKFEFLLGRSPFSLPTAEESSPLAERYALTGAVELGGRQQIFVLDRNSQQRHLVTTEGSSAEMVLLEFFPDPDPRKMRARVRIGPEVTTLAFAEAPTGEPVPNAHLHAPAQPPMPQPPVLSNAQQNPPPRRVIRRRFISANPAGQPAGAPVPPPAPQTAP